METQQQTKPYIVQLRDEDGHPIGALMFSNLANAQGYAFTMLGAEKMSGLVCSAEILTKQADGNYIVTEEMEY
jgi:hypothetical protein